MKKQESKRQDSKQLRLRINGETVRQLNKDNLALVQGGYTDITGTSNGVVRP
jgi:hypothetical protein